MSGLKLYGIVLEFSEETSLSTLFLVTGVLVYPYMTYLTVVTEVRCANEAEPRLNRFPLSFEPTVAVPRSHT